MAPEAPAEAASMGPGYGAPGVGNGPLGSFIAESTGLQVYCLDAGAPTPTAGRTGAPALVSDLHQDSGAPIPAENIAKANAALTMHGQSGDNNWSAAVQLYVWELLDNADYNSHGYSGEVYYVNRAPAGARADIRAKVAQMRAETAGVTPAPTGGSASLQVQMDNAYDGRVIVAASPADATGTLRLDGATVKGGGATAEVRNGSVVEILGTPLDDQNKYAITANAHFTGTGGYAGNLNVYDTPGKQRTVSAGTPGSFGFDATAGAADPLSTIFSPVVGTTVASKFVGLGEGFVDGVTAQVAAGSERWRQGSDGRYRPVVAKGTLYGPFLTAPIQSATPPAGAPVVGTETLTLEGPGNYSSSGQFKADEAGYYTWVWSIDAADQEPRTQNQIPAGYTFADQFGLVAETHITPSSIIASSQVEKAEQVLSGDLVDGIDVSVKDGGWLRGPNGERVPVVFEGTAYYVPGDSAPEVSLEIPEDAVEVGSRKLTVDKPGTFTTKADPLEAPAATAGFVSWVWAIRDENQPEEFRGYVDEWADPFGLPAETVKLQAPAVSTIAEPDVPFGDPATDTALVTGPMPAKPATLTFEAFLQPNDDELTKDDSDGDDAAGEAGAMARTLQGAPLASAQPVCTPENRVFSTEANPITVTTAGEYVSDEAQFEKYGTYFWVATLTAHTGEIISQGECGDPDEVSTVEAFTVASKAVMNVDDQGTAYDTALVTGAVPEGTQLTFQAYKVDPAQPVCTVDTRVLDMSDNPVALTAGMHDEDTEYDSPEHTFGEPGTYYWVETATLANGDVVHVGQCGALNEITTVAAPPVPPVDPPTPVVPPVLAFTGSSPWIGIVLTAALLLSVGIVLAARKRDQDAAHDPELAAALDHTTE